jgi:hypothetical protein
VLKRVKEIIIVITVWDWEGHDAVLC